MTEPHPSALPSTPQGAQSNDGNVQSPEQMQDTPSHGHSATGHPQPRRRSSSVNAKSVEISTAQGVNTGGAVNVQPNPQAVSQQPAKDGTPPTFVVGLSEDRNRKCRRTMEDAHSFVYDFGGVKVRVLDATTTLQPH